MTAHDAIVVGGGIAGLSAAYEFAEAGLRPLLIEARGYVGGLIAGGRVGGVEMDLGAEAFVSRGDAVPSLAADLGLEVIAPQGGGSGLFLPPLRPGGPWALHPLPGAAMLGIPSDPWAADVVAMIGEDGARRAARDAELGPDAGADETSLAGFVEARMGSAVLDRLVRPLTAGIYTADPSELAADVVAPGLRARTREVGSLAGAVAAILAGRTRGAADVSVDGGMFLLVRRMADRIRERGGEIRTRTGAVSVRPLEDGTWALTASAMRPNENPSLEPVPDGEPEELVTPRLVLASSQSATVRLLADVPGVEADVPSLPGSPIARATVVLREPGLSANPVGTGLLVAPDDDPPVKAKALSHLSVKWPQVGRDLAELHGADTHALRLSYGRPGEGKYTPDLTQILADASALTGLSLSEDSVVDSTVVRWDGSLPPRTPDHRRRTAALLEQVAGLPGLAVGGAWVAGSGVTSAVAQAREQARTLMKEHSA